MRAMTMAAAVALLTLAGCVTSGPSPQVVAAAKAQTAELTAERKAGKLTWSQWAEQSNAVLRNEAGSHEPPHFEVYLAYRLLMAQRIDSHQISQEEANYLVQAKAAELREEDDNIHRANAMAALGAYAAMRAAAVPAPQPYMMPTHPVRNTTCSTFGTNTNCTTY